ncbi:hypothetical protein DL546_004957 [Coniochaeta pulveracea]|uniref:Uncharacterized protein n=1 Tax=Coniochaeta pulveracea TaxID=177199 RepID=A0A420Y9Y3_9PEZI|nr:hypothetical protein DL546_004957 [Coniochaeta pulveracea]
MLLMVSDHYLQDPPAWYFSKQLAQHCIRPSIWSRSKRTIQVPAWATTLMRVLSYGRKGALVQAHCDSSSWLLLTASSTAEIQVHIFHICLWSWIFARMQA